MPTSADEPSIFITCSARPVRLRTCTRSHSAVMSRPLETATPRMRRNEPGAVPLLKRGALQELDRALELGATHGLSEPICAVHNTQHGLTNAIVLPIVLRANRSVIEGKLELVSRCEG